MDHIIWEAIQPCFREKKKMILRRTQYQRKRAIMSTFMSIFMSTFQMKPLEKILIEKVRTNVCSQLIYLKFVECAITFNSITL